MSLGSGRRRVDEKISRGIFVILNLFESFWGILVRSHEISQLELSRQVISDVAVIEWGEGQNFK